MLDLNKVERDSRGLKIAQKSQVISSEGWKGGERGDTPLSEGSDQRHT